MCSQKKPTFKRIGAGLALGLLLLALGVLQRPGSQSASGDVTSTTARPTFAYNADSSDGTVSQFRVGNDGGLLPLNPPTVYAGPAPLGITVSHDRHFLYVTNGPGTTLSQFRISADGTLQPLVPPEVSIGYGASLGIIFTRNGRFGYVVNTQVNTVSQFKVGKDGALNPLRPATVPTKTYPQTIYLDPTDRFAYTLNDDSISQFRVRADGTLAALAPAALTTPGIGYAMAFDKSGRFAYVPGLRMLQYRVARDGTLTALAGPSTIEGGDVLAWDPLGRFLYIDHPHDSDGTVSLVALQVAPDGHLKMLPDTGPRVAGDLSEPAFTPSGAYVYIAIVFTYQALQLQVHRDGSLSGLRPAVVAVYGGLNYMVVDPTGRFAYALDRGGSRGDSGIFQFRIGKDGTLHALSVPRIPTGRGSGPLVLVR